MVLKKEKKCMKMKVFAKKFNFSNGHVYAFIKIWELTSSTFCDYKNFEKQRKWMEKKLKFKKFQRRTCSDFFKNTMFSTPLVSSKVQIGLNEPQIIRFPLSVKKNTRFVFFCIRKGYEKYPWEFSQYKIKIEICFDRKCFVV